MYWGLFWSALVLETRMSQTHTSASVPCGMRSTLFSSRSFGSQTTIVGLAAQRPNSNGISQRDAERLGVDISPLIRFAGLSTITLTSTYCYLLGRMHHVRAL